MTNSEHIERAVPKDAPVMVAWEIYKAGEDYANSRRWALHEEHVDGSMWAAFYVGFFAAAINNAGAAGEARDKDHDRAIAQALGREHEYMTEGLPIGVLDAALALPADDEAKRIRAEVIEEAVKAVRRQGLGGAINNPIIDALRALSTQAEQKEQAP